MKTILLDTSSWDLVLDASGNIAVASNPYALAQDAASAIKTFLGEVFWDTAIGVPYRTQILGKNPSLTLLKARFVAAAKTVPEVGAARCFLSSISARSLVGQVQVVSTERQVSAANLSLGVLNFPVENSGSSLDFSNPQNSQFLPMGI